MSAEHLDKEKIEEYLLYVPIPSSGESEDDLEPEDDTVIPELTLLDLPIQDEFDIGFTSRLDHDYLQLSEPSPEFRTNETLDDSLTNRTDTTDIVNEDVVFAGVLPDAANNNTVIENLISEPSTSRGTKRKRGQRKNEKPVKYGPVERPIPTWSKIAENGPTRSGIVTGTVGVSDQILSMDDPSPIHLFETMITDEMVDNIVFQTNLYAEQSGKRYIPTTRKEMKAFLGINILMGIKRSPSYRDYWSNEIDLNDPFISRIMPVNRFSWLLGNLHLNDNSVMPLRGDERYDKLYKLRPFLNSIGKTFEENFKPGQILAVDESMIKFKGRSSLKQYLPKKPIKRGYKLWVLADKSGYVIKFEIYTGKVSEGRQFDLGPSVVRRLTECLQEKHHSVYIDNYFVSVFLMEDLKNVGINACGTINIDRKHLPKFKETKHMARGESEWFISNNGVSAMKWIDNKPVHLVSNFHDPSETTLVKRKQQDGNRINVTCPVAISDYNLHMNCVDKFDQRKSAYEISRKSRKWWHRIFFYLTDAAVVNAFAIHNCLPFERLDLKTFRRKIVFGLVGDQYVGQANNSPGPNGQLKVSNSKTKVPVEIRLSGSSHQPARGNRRRCAVCSTKKKQVSTNWMCVVCSVPLCLSKNKNCFQNYHSKH